MGARCTLRQLSNFHWAVGGGKRKSGEVGGGGERGESCEEIDPICVGSVGDVKYLGHTNVFVLFDVIEGKQTSKCKLLFHARCRTSEKNTDSDTDDQSRHVCCCWCNCSCCCCCCWCCRLGCGSCSRRPVVCMFFFNALQFVYWSVLITNSGELHQTTDSILFVISFHSALLLLLPRYSSSAYRRSIERD